MNWCWLLHINIIQELLKAPLHVSAGLKLLKHIFLPRTINEWNKIDLVSKTHLTWFSENICLMKLGPKQIQYIICIILRILLSWLRLGLSHQTIMHIQHLSWINISFLFALSSFLFSNANTFWSLKIIDKNPPKLSDGNLKLKFFFMVTINSIIFKTALY